MQNRQTLQRAALTLLMTSAVPFAVAQDDVATPRKQAIVPPGFESTVENFGYSPAVRAGDFVYLAGVVGWLPRNEDGSFSEATPEAMEASFERAFQQIATVLAAAGASWDDVVEMTTFHTEIEQQGEVFLRVKDKFVKAPHPAWTAIDIDQLWTKQAIVEIKVVAYAPLEES